MNTLNRLNRLKEMLLWKKSKRFYAYKLGISVGEVDKLLDKLKGDVADEDDSGETYKLLPEDGELTVSKYWDHPPTPEEVIESHKIDLSKWKLSQIWMKQKSKGYLVSALFSSKKLDNDIVAQKELLLKELRDNSPKVKYTPPKLEAINMDCLYEISIPDMHFGKLAYRAESGEDYDLKIAIKRYKDAVEELLSRANLMCVEKFLLPIGNDIIHVDSDKNTTYADTPQDCDSRFAKMVVVVKKLLIETIDRLSIIAPVDILVIKGNHDSTVTFLLGEILESYYHNNECVNVNNSPKWRKYYQYGRNGFLYTHGDKENHKDLGLIFATEEPKLWADTKHRFCKLGHLHKSKKTEYTSVDSHQGFQVEILPSLSGTDEWHYSKGYLSNKQAKGFIYHKEKGEIAAYTYTV